MVNQTPWCLDELKMHVPVDHQWMIVDDDWLSVAPVAKPEKFY